MGAAAGDLNRLLSVLAALAAVFLILWYGAPASRVRTFLLLSLSHGEDPFLSRMHESAYRRRSRFSELREPSEY